MPRSRTAALCLALGLLCVTGWSQSWTKLTNQVPDGGQPYNMRLLTDGTVMAQNGGSPNWLRLTPDANGSYIVSHLTPGTYSITVALAGFKTLSRPNLILNLDQQIELDLTLSVGATADSVTVTASTPVMQTHSVDTGQVIEGREILDLPLEGPRRCSTRLVAWTGWKTER